MSTTTTKTAGMNVNFNNLRRQAILTHDRLVGKLNDKIKNGEIEIMVREIQEDMDELRSLIGTIGCCYDPDNEDCKDVYSELFPLDSEYRMQQFNPEL
jgi:hypothetical protein